MAVHVIVPSNTVGSPFAVCATYKSSAVTGLTQPFLPKYMHSETIMRLEQAPHERTDDRRPRRGSRRERLGFVQGAHIETHGRRTNPARYWS